MKLHGAELEDLRTKEVKTLFVIKPSGADLAMNRATVYATPRHNARTTKEYSVSFPVCTVRSQLSNVSRSGQIRQIIRTSAAVARYARDRIHSSIAQQQAEMSNRR